MSDVKYVKVVRLKVIVFAGVPWGPTTVNHVHLISSSVFRTMFTSEMFLYQRNVVNADNSVAAFTEKRLTNSVVCLCYIPYHASAGGVVGVMTA